MNTVPPHAFDLMIPDSPADDRRRDPRYMLSLSVTLQGDNNFYTGLSEDISDGGVFIATHRVLPVGTPVVLWFTTPDSDAPCAVSGTVRWIREPAALAGAQNNFGPDKGAPPSIRAGMGVQFHDVPDATRRAIRAFMQCRRPEFFE